MSHSFGGSYEFNYEYDQNGNITRISDDSGNLRNEYTYDELGRLTSEINIPKGSQSSKAVVGEKIEYLYSKDGNIYQRISIRFRPFRARLMSTQKPTVPTASAIRTPNGRISFPRQESTARDLTSPMTR